MYPRNQVINYLKIRSPRKGQLKEIMDNMLFMQLCHACFGCFWPYLNLSYFQFSYLHISNFLLLLSYKFQDQPYHSIFLSHTFSRWLCFDNFFQLKLLIDSLSSCGTLFNHNIILWSCAWIANFPFLADLWVIYWD